MGNLINFGILVCLLSGAYVLMSSYTEEKFKVMGLHGRMVEVVLDNIKDEDTKELVTTLRIQEVTKPNVQLD